MTAKVKQKELLNRQSHRIWWIIAFSLSAIACAGFILKVMVKWNEAPIVITFAEKSTPVWEIPFPAVTICPETKADVVKLNFTNMYKLLIENRMSEVSEDS